MIWIQILVPLVSIQLVAGLIALVRMWATINISTLRIAELEKEKQATTVTLASVSSQIGGLSVSIARVEALLQVLMADRNKIERI